MGYWSTLGIPHTCFLFFALAFLTEVDRGMDPSIRHCQVCDSGDVSCNPGTTIPKTVAKRDRCRVSAYTYSELFGVPPRAPEVAVHSTHRNRGYSLFLLLVPPQPRPVH